MPLTCVITVLTRLADALPNLGDIGGQCRLIWRFLRIHIAPAGRLGDDRRIELPRGVVDVPNAADVGQDAIVEKPLVKAIGEAITYSVLYSAKLLVEPVGV